MSSFTGGSLAGGAGQKIKLKLKPKQPAGQAPGADSLGPPAAAAAAPAIAAGGASQQYAAPQHPAAPLPPLPPAPSAGSGGVVPKFKLKKAASTGRRPQRTAAAGVTRLTHILAGVRPCSSSSSSYGVAAVGHGAKCTARGPQQDVPVRQHSMHAVDQLFVTCGRLPGRHLTVAPTRRQAHSAPAAVV